MFRSKIFVLDVTFSPLCVSIMAFFMSLMLAVILEKKAKIKNNQMELSKLNFQVILDKETLVFNKTTVKSKTERRRKISKNCIDVI